MLTPRSRGSVADSFASIARKEVLSIGTVGVVVGGPSGRRWALVIRRAIDYSLISRVSSSGTGRKRNFHRPKKKSTVVGDLAKQFDGVFQYGVRIRGNGARVVVELPE